jgi:RNA polymerase sigma-70 factor, ECF subfamily
MPTAVEAEMVTMMPQLHAFAFSLCRNPDQANDLVQETLLRACNSRDSFESGTNLRAWLTTILRNQFYGEYRKRRREVQDNDGIYTETMVAQPGQLAYAQHAELLRALARLPREMREVLVLVGMHGASQAEAARISDCPIGTIKSRLHRARASLSAMLSISSVADYGTDADVQAIMARVESRRTAQAN